MRLRLAEGPLCSHQWRDVVSGEAGWVFRCERCKALLVMPSGAGLIHVETDDRPAEGSLSDERPIPGEVEHR